MITILITGCSSGFGLETASLFLERGWSVVATMRKPDEGLFDPSDRLRVLPLDVTDEKSITDAVAAAGNVDVLVNNAGIGWLNALEGTPMSTVREIFDTNTFGMISMMQAVLPNMRARGSGVIVNVTSSVTLAPLPLLSVYTASKAAINSLTASVALELRDFGIRTRVVIPGQSPDTGFGSKGLARVREAGGFPDAYAAFTNAVLDRMKSSAQTEKTHSPDVAEAIWTAATDPDAPFRIPAGADAVAAFTE